ncbi:hypothetical protein [Azospirillum sp. B2RO_4]|uniref:hypothetical protein n=1 Tax=Azospirillum sp. B2RO_4 TaxID=3027796 RepID=UPI003DA7B1AC
MTPDRTNAALTILDYWQAIEALSPAAPPKNDRRDHAWTAADETTLPWHERMRATYAETRDRRWRFQVHIGLFEMEKVVEELRERLGVDDDEERPRGREASMVCLCVTADGHPFGVPAVSAVPWAMNEIAEAKGELRFGDFGAVEERIATRITDYLAEREILESEGEGTNPSGDAPALTLADCDAIEPDLMNSFFLRDLGRVSAAVGRGDHASGLAGYLLGHDGGVRWLMCVALGYNLKTLCHFKTASWPRSRRFPIVRCGSLPSRSVRMIRNPTHGDYCVKPSSECGQRRPFSWPRFRETSLA